MNAATLALDNIGRYGEYLGFHYRGREIRNTEQQRCAGQVARMLHEHGVRPGDRVMLMMPNSPDLLASFYGAWMIGAAVVPVAPQLTAREAEYVVHDSGARVALTVPACADVLAATPLPQLLVFGAADVPAASTAPWTGMVERAPDDMALLLYTSGTTAQPKGVILTHRNVLACCESCSLMYPQVERCVILQLLPLFHVYGILMFNVALSWGLTSVILPQFDAALVFGALQELKPARTAVVPTMMVYLMQAAERTRYDVSSLRRVLSGGGPLAEEVRIRFAQAFGSKVEQGYGLSETMGIATAYGDDDAYRAGSSGRTMPLLEIQIADDDGRRLPPRQRGEIRIRGPVVSPGYWHNAEATRAAFRDGWLLTGDVGYQDEDGYLYILERKKDLIIKGGENISPREIEEVIHQHRAVAEVAVVGVADSVFGENICALVVLKPGEEAGADDIRRHAAQHLMKFKVPEQVLFRPSLPKNAAGKVLKRVLRQELAAQATPAA